MILKKVITLYGFKCEACGAEKQPDNDDSKHYCYCTYCGAKLEEVDMLHG